MSDEDTGGGCSITLLIAVLLFLGPPAVLMLLGG
jgi:hypothetical protein